jgi:hypothetical protein
MANGTNGNKNGMNTIVLSVTGIVVFFAAAAVAIAIWDSKDAVLIIPILFAALGLIVPQFFTQLAALEAARKAGQASDHAIEATAQATEATVKVAEIKKQIDGRMTEMVDLTRSDSEQRGKLAQMAIQQGRDDALAASSDTQTVTTVTTSSPVAPPPEHEVHEHVAFSSDTGTGGSEAGEGKTR